MKRSQLKALVKECVREIILEEGLLKTIVTEVAEGLNAGLVVESRQAPVPSHEQGFRKQMKDSRKKVLGSIGKSGYEDAKRKFDNPALFEGTKPLPGGNSPIGVDNYATDNRTNKIIDDPHGSIFVSRRVNLKQPATSLKVLVGASVQPEADFRVFYRLFTADSSEVSQTYRAFPGYKNLIDIDGDGFGDEIIDINLNDGRADAKLESNPIGQFSEYQFSIDNLEQFSGFTIKIVMTSTNECVPVRLKDFRAIALA